MHALLLRNKQGMYLLLTLNMDVFVDSQLCMSSICQASWYWQKAWVNSDIFSLTVRTGSEGSKNWNRHWGWEAWKWNRSEALKTCHQSCYYHLCIQPVLSITPPLPLHHLWSHHHLLCWPLLHQRATEPQSQDAKHQQGVQRNGRRRKLMYGQTTSDRGRRRTRGREFERQTERGRRRRGLHLGKGGG